MGIHVENMITILNLIGNIGGGTLYNHLISTSVFTLIMKRTFARASKITRKVATTSIWIC